MATRSYYCDWLPAADDVLSKHQHTPVVQLPAVRSLRAQSRHVGQTAPMLGQDLENWNIFQDSMRDEWKERRGSEVEIPQGPILFDDDDCLEGLFTELNALFFQTDLTDEVEVYWVDSDPDHRGRTYHNPDTGLMVIEIARPGISHGCYTGDHSVRIISTLLHEMCHAYVDINICHCDRCEATPYRIGRDDHGNPWIEIARLVQEAANRTFRSLGHFELSWWRYHEIERLLSRIRP